MSRKDRRASMFRSKSKKALLQQLGNIKNSWEQLLGHIEDQNELRPDALVENLPAQGYLMERLGEVEETILGLQYGAVKGARVQSLELQVAGHQQHLTEFVQTVQAAQKKAGIK